MYVIYNTSIRCWYFRAISVLAPRKLIIYSLSCDDDIKSDSTLSTVYYKYQLLHLLIHLEHPINQVYNKKDSQLDFGRVIDTVKLKLFLDFTPFT